ncbi:hypothetical protein GCM10010392_66210 [Streptomyces clavifer]|uniref:Integral membrane protein TerC n=1 Tax=Streptomyces clavifer TaxID=68188 RepID=A0ABS4VHY5_9ACTN|nr:hypothetical protein [Streptomyces clavifer]GHB28798.1 hypothetical protein GCM10010392_66210 [Streptomyces clavifer]
MEKSLSVDNLFVFALIFAYFKVPREYQHRVLFFGVVGALVFRAIFLTLDFAVVNRFTFVLFLFAAILFYSAFKILKGEDDSFDPGKSFAVRMLRKIMPVRDEYAGTRFVIKKEGRRVATPLLAVVAAIEAADLLFAVDSVPAVLGGQRRRLHRLHQQRVRHPGAAGSVHPAGGAVGPLSLPEHGPGDHSGLHRHQARPSSLAQDDQYLHSGDSLADQPGGDRRHSDGLDCAQHSAPTAEHVHRRECGWHGESEEAIWR